MRLRKNGKLRRLLKKRRPRLTKAETVEKAKVAQAALLEGIQIILPREPHASMCKH
jgi:hypothetical protein